jgi:biopolymer transport protein ExbB/TolQ
MKDCFVTSNKVLLQMQLTVKYQAVKKEGFNSEEAAETIHKEIEEATSLEMPMLQKNMIIISLVSLGTLLRTVAGMIKAFGALAAAGTPDQAALAAGISEALINNRYWNFSCSNYLLQFLYFQN